MLEYSYFTHKHRFAAWAAARAAQRGLTDVATLADALEQSGVVEFLQDPMSLDTSKDAFDTSHLQWCRSIVEHLSNEGVENVTFGRAAKLIAVYLKTMVIVGADPDSSLAKVAHPPIDRILLQKLSRADEVKSPHKKEWRKTRWTKLDEAEYRILINQLRSCLQPAEPMWHLEKYWTATND